MKFAISMLFLVSLLAHGSVVNSAHFSKVAYESSPQTVQTLIYQHENKIFGNKLMAFYDSKTDSIYIAVRGTDELSNWVSNTHIAASALDVAAGYFISRDYQKYYDRLKKGPQTWFVLAFKDLEKASLRVLNKHPNTKIIFTGHSYGGLMANLLAQSAYTQNPDLNFECHTFNSPGAAEIRSNSLNMPRVPKQILENRFFNHVRVTDLVGKTNTHEGNVLYYKPAGHAIGYFAQDLADGMEPI